MFNTKIKIMTSLIFVFTLAACGGSGGGSQPESITSVDNSDLDVNAIVETDGQAVIEMGDLKASAEFNFTSKHQVKVSLDLTELIDFHNQTGQRAYVSVYREYMLLPSGIFYPDSSSRVLGGEINDGQFQHSFVSLNNQDAYLIEIWFYNGEPPIQKEQTIVASNITW